MITKEQVVKQIKKNPLKGYNPVLIESIKAFYKDIYNENSHLYGVKKGKVYPDNTKNCLGCILEQYNALKRYVKERTD